MSLPTFTLSAIGSRMDAVGSSFAYDLAKRISQGKGLDASQAAGDAAAAKDDGQASALAEKQGQLTKLESALAGTVSFMRNNHGDKAASAMVALVYKRIGNGEINEESLGNAFLDVTRFIDRNFGTGAGDAFMAHLNGTLNTSMNAFFDNGLSETFMVAPTSAEGGAGLDTSSMLEDIAKQYTDAIKEMIEEARARPETGGPMAAYADPLQKEAMVGVMKDVLV